MSEVTKQWLQEGYKNGFADGQENTILSFLADGIITKEKAAETLGITEEELLARLKESKKQ